MRARLSYRLLLMRNHGPPFTGLTPPTHYFVDNLGTLL